MGDRARRAEGPGHRQARRAVQGGRRPALGERVTPTSKFGTFEASDLGQYLRAIDAQHRRAAAISRVPAHYLMQSNLANPPTAESLVAAESGLVAKVRERQRRFGEAWERAAGARARADRRPSPASRSCGRTPRCGTRRRSPTPPSKLQTIGVPQRALLEYVGATPQQIAEWTLEAAAAELVALATTPPAGPNGAVQDRRHRRRAGAARRRARARARRAAHARYQNPSTEEAFALYAAQADPARRRRAAPLRDVRDRLPRRSCRRRARGRRRRPSTRALAGVAVTAASPVARSPGAAAARPTRRTGDDEAARPPGRRLLRRRARRPATCTPRERGGLDEARPRRPARRSGGWRKELGARAVPVVRHDRVGRRPVPSGRDRTVSCTRPLRGRARVRRRVGGRSMAEEKQPQTQPSSTKTAAQERRPRSAGGLAPVQGELPRRPARRGAARHDRAPRLRPPVRGRRSPVRRGRAR